MHRCNRAGEDGSKLVFIHEKLPVLQSSASILPSHEFAQTEDTLSLDVFKTTEVTMEEN